MTDKDILPKETYTFQNDHEPASFPPVLPGQLLLVLPMVMDMHYIQLSDVREGLCIHTDVQPTLLASLGSELNMSGVEAAGAISRKLKEYIDWFTGSNTTINPPLWTE